ncbi:MAG: hypothetical protein V7756_16525 [Halopseudomonas sp.]|uniref:hypothetical protein n=1 Tax=Halopseudomonas sp. TaxID=2901191 RepID=UPI0030035813
MQNHTHQAQAVSEPKPQPLRCGVTLSEHLSTLPALQHAAGNHPMLHDWLQHMLAEAVVHNDVMLNWYTSRADGYLLGVGIAAKKRVTSEMLELGQLCRRLKAGPTQ